MDQILLQSPLLTPTPIWLIALPLLVAFLSPLWGRARWPLLFGVHLGLFALALWLLAGVQDGPLIETLVIAPPLGIHLHADAVSLLLVALLTFAVALVAAFLWQGARAPHWQSRQAFVLIMLLSAGCNGMLLTGDLFNLYVFIEIAGVSAYLLSALRRDAAALEAGLKYLIIGAVSAVFILFATVLTYITTGTLNLAAIGMAFADIPAAMQILIGLLLLVGLGIKAELFPFNVWVPEIYRGSDPEASALFSGVVVKAFLFVLFNLVFLILADPAVVGRWLMILGGVTMVIAELTALRQRDLRRMLAYSSLGQVGLITLALGFAETTVVAGGLFHLVNHTLAKLLLFMVAALMLSRASSGHLDALTGIARRLPLAAGLFVLGSLSMLGLPPLAGFMSKLWIMAGFAEAGVFWPIALILLGALLEAAYFFRWIALFYRPVPAPRLASDPVGLPTASSAVTWPLLVLAVLLIGFGLAPVLLEPALNLAAEVLLDRSGAIEAVMGVRP
ncbi:sodium:proton antiporter [Thiocapsa imhoffii]|uniref:Sodium:proton antiporter n=2 Tax=Thiocapsa imhoffii TaxID=382777 RepID=A0A9X0WKN2_9GAMM|nr:sodium:proton antiporter [Thiocapsa imhoffii]